MEIIDVIVEFDKFCKTCKHKNLDEKFDPCHECLSNPINTGSIKPIKYVEDEELIKKEEKNKKEN